MLYNKNKYTKTNEKKILHKVGKHWVTVTLSTLMMLGGVGVAGTTAAHADTTDDTDRNSKVLHNRISNSVPKATLMRANNAQQTQTDSASNHSTKYNGDLLSNTQSSNAFQSSQAVQLQHPSVQGRTNRATQSVNRNLKQSTADNSVDNVLAQARALHAHIMNNNVKNLTAQAPADNYTYSHYGADTINYYDADNNDTIVASHKFHGKIGQSDSRIKQITTSNPEYLDTSKYYLTNSGQQQIKNLAVDNLDFNNRNIYIEVADVRQGTDTVNFVTPDGTKVDSDVFSGPYGRPDNDIKNQRDNSGYVAPGIGANTQYVSDMPMPSSESGYMLDNKGVSQYKSEIEPNFFNHTGKTVDLEVQPFQEGTDTVNYIYNGKVISTITLSGEYNSPDDYLNDVNIRTTENGSYSANDEEFSNYLESVSQQPGLYEGNTYNINVQPTEKASSTINIIDESDGQVITHYKFTGPKNEFVDRFDTPAGNTLENSGMDLFINDYFFKSDGDRGVKLPHFYKNNYNNVMYFYGPENGVSNNFNHLGKDPNRWEGMNDAKYQLTNTARRFLEGAGITGLKYDNSTTNLYVRKAKPMSTITVNYTYNGTILNKITFHGHVGEPMDLRTFATLDMNNVPKLDMPSNIPTPVYNSDMGLSAFADLMVIPGYRFSDADSNGMLWYSDAPKTVTLPLITKQANDKFIYEYQGKPVYVANLVGENGIYTQDTENGNGNYVSLPQGIPGVGEAYNAPDVLKQYNFSPDFDGIGSVKLDNSTHIIPLDINPDAPKVKQYQADFVLNGKVVSTATRPIYSDTVSKIQSQGNVLNPDASTDDQNLIDTLNTIGNIPKGYGINTNDVINSVQDSGNTHIVKFNLAPKEFNNTYRLSSGQVFKYHGPWGQYTPNINAPAHYHFADGSKSKRFLYQDGNQVLDVVPDNVTDKINFIGDSDANTTMNGVYGDNGQVNPPAGYHFIFDDNGKFVFNGGTHSVHVAVDKDLATPSEIASAISSCRSLCSQDMAKLKSAFDSYENSANAANSGEMNSLNALIKNDFNSLNSLQSASASAAQSNAESYAWSLDNSTDTSINNEINQDNASLNNNIVATSMSASMNDISLSNAINGLKDNLSANYATKAELSNNASSLQNNINNNTASITDLENARNQINESLTNLMNSASANSASAFANSSAIASLAQKSQVDSAQINNLISKVNNDTTNITSLTNQVTNLSNSASNAINNADSDAKSYASSAVSSVNGSISNSVNADINNINNSINNARNYASSIANSYASSVSNNVTNINNSLNSYISSNNNNIISLSNSASNAVNQASQNANNSYQSALSQGSASASSAYAHAQSDENSMKNSYDIEIASLSNSANIYINDTRSYASSLANQNASQASSYADSLSQSVTNLSNSANTTINNLSNSANSDYKSAENSINSNANRLASDEANYTSLINSAVASASNATSTAESVLNNTINNNTNSLNANIDNKATSINNQMAEDSADLRNAITNNTDLINEDSARLSGDISQASSNASFALSVASSAASSATNSLSGVVSADNSSAASELNSLSINANYIWSELNHLEDVKADKSAVNAYVNSLSGATGSLSNSAASALNSAENSLNNKEQNDSLAFSKAINALSGLATYNNSEISNISKAVNNVNIKNISDNVKSLNSEIANKANKSDVDNTIDEINKTIQQNKMITDSNYNSLVNTVNGKADVSSLNKAVESINSIGSQVTNDEKSINNDTDSINKLNTDYSTLNQAFNDFKSYAGQEINNISSSVADTNNRLQSMDNSLNDDINSLSNNKANDSDVKNNYNSINSLVNDIASLNDKNADTSAATQNAINSLNSALNNKADINSISSLQNEINSLNSTKADVTDVASLSDNINGLKNAITSLSINDASGIGSLNAQLSNKANVNDINSLDAVLNGINASLNLKADKTTVNSLAEQFETSIKANADNESAAVESLDNRLASMADGNAINSLANDIQKLTTSGDINNANVQNTIKSLMSLVNNKADTNNIDSELSNISNEISHKANSSDVNDVINSLGNRINNDESRLNYENTDVVRNGQSIRDLMTILRNYENQNNNTINSMNNDINSKANQSNVDSLSNAISSMDSAKASVNDLNYIQNEINSLNNRAASEEGQLHNDENSLNSTLASKANYSDINSVANDIVNIETNLNTKMNASTAYSLANSLATDIANANNANQKSEAINHTDTALNSMAISNLADNVKGDVQGLQNALATKADASVTENAINSLNSVLAGKADISSVNSAINQLSEANSNALNSLADSLNVRLDQNYADSVANAKQTDNDLNQLRSAVDSKADAGTVNSLASHIESELSTMNTNTNVKFFDIYSQIMNAMNNNQSSNNDKFSQIDSALNDLQNDISHAATKCDVQHVLDLLNNAETRDNTSMESMNTVISSNSASASNAINSLSNALNSMNNTSYANSSAQQSTINSIENSVADLNGRVNGDVTNSEFDNAVNSINNELAGKATNADLSSFENEVHVNASSLASAINNNVNNIDYLMSTKANSQDVDNAIMSLNSAIGTKADGKSMADAINSLDNAIAAKADKGATSAEINSINSTIATLATKNTVSHEVNSLAARMNNEDTSISHAFDMVNRAIATKADAKIVDEDLTRMGRLVDSRLSHLFNIQFRNEQANKSAEDSLARDVAINSAAAQSIAMASLSNCASEAATSTSVSDAIKELNSDKASVNDITKLENALSNVKSIEANDNSRMKNYAESLASKLTSKISQESAKLSDSFHSEVASDNSNLTNQIKTITRKLIDNDNSNSNNAQSLSKLQNILDRVKNEYATKGDLSRVVNNAISKLQKVINTKANENSVQTDLANLKRAIENHDQNALSVYSSQIKADLAKLQNGKANKSDLVNIIINNAKNGKAIHNLQGLKNLVNKLSDLTKASEAAGKADQANNWKAFDAIIKAINEGKPVNDIDINVDNHKPNNKPSNNNTPSNKPSSSSSNNNHKPAKPSSNSNNNVNQNQSVDIVFYEYGNDIINSAVYHGAKNTWFNADNNLPQGYRYHSNTQFIFNGSIHVVKLSQGDNKPSDNPNSNNNVTPNNTPNNKPSSSSSNNNHKPAKPSSNSNNNVNQNQSMDIVFYEYGNDIINSAVYHGAKNTWFNADNNLPQGYRYHSNTQFIFNGSIHVVKLSQGDNKPSDNPNSNNNVTPNNTPASNSANNVIPNVPAQPNNEPVNNNNNVSPTIINRLPNYPSSASASAGSSSQSNSTASNSAKSASNNVKPAHKPSKHINMHSKRGNHNSNTNEFNNINKMSKPELERKLSNYLIRNSSSYPKGSEATINTIMPMRGMTRRQDINYTRGFQNAALGVRVPKNEVTAPKFKEGYNKGLNFIKPNNKLPQTSDYVNGAYKLAGAAIVISIMLMVLSGIAIEHRHNM